MKRCPKLVLRLGRRRCRHVPLHCSVEAASNLVGQRMEHWVLLQLGLQLSLQPLVPTSRMDAVHNLIHNNTARHGF